MRKTTRFRQLLRSQELEFLLEAHNGLSARICEEAGFAGIWASGLCLSAQFGVRDSNEASWTQILEMLEFMADATSVPILLDGDTGYGNFNNVRRLVHKLEQRDIAAVCIEDKLFPKKNSFIQGEAQPLEGVEEFCGKIKAGKDAQQDDDFSIVARTEALIAGWSLDEALRRAHAYVEAGADAILIHSKQSSPKEVLAFREAWGETAPLVIVPTTYYSTPTDVFRQAGFSVAIWANHLLRASLSAMQQAATTIFEQGGLQSIEDRVAPIREVFRLQGADELAAAESRYLPRGHDGARAVVLAASRGKELGELTENKPKALVEIGGTPLLARIVATYNAVGVKDITVVRGYRKEAIDLPNLKYVDNDEFETTGELRSLQLALEALDDVSGPLLVSYGDVLFNRFIPELLLDRAEDLVVTVDTQWDASANLDRDADYVHCTAPSDRWSLYEDICLLRVDAETPEAERHGEWTGFLKIAGAAVPRVRDAVRSLLESPKNRTAGMPVLLNRLVESDQPVRVVYTAGHWLDIDGVTDVERAGSF